MDIYDIVLQFFDAVITATDKPHALDAISTAALNGRNQIANIQAELVTQQATFESKRGKTAPRPVTLKERKERRGRA